MAASRGVVVAVEGVVARGGRLVVVAAEPGSERCSAATRAEDESREEVV